jgi:hypothetical protein
MKEKTITMAELRKTDLYKNVRKKLLSPQTKPLSKEDVYGLALQSGFMLSTQYGQGKDKLMPVTDGDTLMALTRAIEAKVRGEK